MIENYRPVSLTSVVCKVLERMIRKKWIEHLERYSLLTDKQFGFRSGRSCVGNLLSFYDRITKVLPERQGWMDCIYLDFKKAFHRVPHKRLLWKLEMQGGIQGSLLAWMKDFLVGRKMRTVVRGQSSSWRDVTSGVPQGAVLALLMFILYINDMPNKLSRGSYINLFADDAKVTRQILDLDSCIVLQQYIATLYE